MKIGIVGRGAVAQTLGKSWAAAGHEVYVGARDPQSEKLTSWAQAANVQTGSIEDVATFGEVILLAINPWTEIEPLVKKLQDRLAGKTVIDVSNNMDFAARPVRFAFSDKSMGQVVQDWIPKSHVVKTLNLTPAPMMVNPKASGIVPAIMWMAGNDKTAKEQTTKLVEDLGWEEVVDLGSIEQSRLQETMGLVSTIIVSNVMAK